VAVLELVMVKSARLRQSVKALSSTLFTLPGSEMLNKPVCENDIPLRRVSCGALPNVTDVKDAQPKKAVSPIDVTVSGIAMVDIAVPRNTLLLIAVSFGALPNVTDVKDVQPMKVV
jgi:hypothetical protein